MSAGVSSHRPAAETGAEDALRPNKGLLRTREESSAPARWRQGQGPNQPPQETSCPVRPRRCHTGRHRAP